MAKNVAVLPNQLHLGAQKILFRFWIFSKDRRHLESIFLPEMNSQRAVIHTNIPLLKALTPAVAVLTGNVVAEDGLLIIEQRVSFSSTVRHPHSLLPQISTDGTALTTLRRTESSSW